LATKDDIKILVDTVRSQPCVQGTQVKAEQMLNKLTEIKGHLGMYRQSRPIENLKTSFQSHPNIEESVDELKRSYAETGDHKTTQPGTIK